MRFEDKGLTPGNYKWAFLASIVELAPEVMKSLRTLTPKYKKVFGAFDYRRAMDVFDFLVASKTNDLNYILSGTGACGLIWRKLSSISDKI